MQIDYAHLNAFLLISDGSGRQIGTASDGRRVAKIPHAFYEDGDEASAATGLALELEPEQITIQYPQAGRYEIAVTSRTGKAASFRITFHNCGKQLSKQIEIPEGKPGAKVRWHFFYRPTYDFEPELLGDKSASQRQNGTKSSTPSRLKIQTRSDQ